MAVIPQAGQWKLPVISGLDVTGRVVDALVVVVVLAVGAQLTTPA